MKHRMATCMLLAGVLMTGCSQENDRPAVSAEASSSSAASEPQSSSSASAPTTVAEASPANAESGDAIVGVPIDDQSFSSVSFEKLGDVRFITTGENRDGKNRLRFYVASAKGTTELTYEPADPDAYYEMKAVAFKDADADGLKDIVIIADYTTGFGRMGAIPVSQVLIYTQMDEGFAENASLEERIASASPYRMLTVSAALALVNADAESAASEAWAQLPPGEYRIEGADEYDGSTLTIEQAAADAIVFSLEAFHVVGGEEGVKNGNVHVGNLDHVTATLAGGEMVYKDKDADYELALSLLSPGQLYLHGQGEPIYGANVNVDGPYRQ